MKKTGAYERFVRPLLFSLDPETAHHLTINCLRAVSHFSPALTALGSFAPAGKPIKLFGLAFRGPLGLAAGFDKNGVALPAWVALGFGFIEIGTVTAKPQPGNPKPRIFRFPDEQALINRLGFNNDGADAVATRLRKLRASQRWPQVPVGINIGKSKMTPIEDALDDYLYSFRLLSPFTDYIALNVRSPNTPGLRSLQEAHALTKLLSAVRDENRSARKPILLKIAPDLSPADLEQIIAVCEAYEVSGIIATNTTLDHNSISPVADQSGGLSGLPLRDKSTEIIRFLRSRSKLPVIGSGGIFDAESAREKIEAGAELLQVYTGYIYRGPSLLREIVTALEM